MEDREFLALRAKVRMANDYLEQVLRYRGKIDAYDVMKVVTRKMREAVEIATVEQARLDGLGIVRIRGVA